MAILRFAGYYVTCRIASRNEEAPPGKTVFCYIFVFLNEICKVKRPIENTKKKTTHISSNLPRSPNMETALLIIISLAKKIYINRI